MIVYVPMLLGVNVNCSCWAAVMMSGRKAELRQLRLELFDPLHEVLVKWLVNSFQRPWGVASSLVEIDTLTCDCIHVLFKFVASSEVFLAIKLAQDGINLRVWLFAWW
ncbi:hypothetical protein V6N12_054170 [Hibiscus sabdariffa]|uniref:Uncharacterized protein n=1 Tax=Hibiscus sabdariffa TaxID=183260 RepID=A0ABR2B9A7_9ROSI